MTTTKTTKLAWTDPFHGLSHFGELRDIRRASVQELGSIEKVELHKWYQGCGFSPVVEIHASLSAAKKAGEQWVAEAITLAE